MDGDVDETGRGRREAGSFSQQLNGLRKVMEHDRTRSASQRHYTQEQYDAVKAFARHRGVDQVTAEYQRNPIVREMMDENEKSEIQEAWRILIRERRLVLKDSMDQVDTDSKAILQRLLDGAMVFMIDVEGRGVALYDYALGKWQYEGEYDSTVWTDEVEIVASANSPRKSKRFGPEVIKQKVKELKKEHPDAIFLCQGQDCKSLGEDGQFKDIVQLMKACFEPFKTTVSRAAGNDEDAAVEIDDTCWSFAMDMFRWFFCMDDAGAHTAKTDVVQQLDVFESFLDLIRESWNL